MFTPSQNKVALFVCNDLTGLLFLNAAIPRVKALGYEPAIYNTGDYHNRKFKIPSPETVSFYNVELLRDTLIPHLEKKPQAEADNVTFRQLSSKFGLEYHEIKDVNASNFLAEVIEDERFCGAVAERFLQVFEPEIINVFREKGFIWNLHSGLLPEYKGLLTPYRAIENGETKYGMTLHEMARKVDEGAIIAQTPLPLDRTKPVLDLYIDTIPSGVDMLEEALTHYRDKGYVHTTPQPKANYPCYTNPTKTEFSKFVAQGVVYATPLKVAGTLTRLFSKSGSEQSIELERALQNAVLKHEREKTFSVLSTEHEDKKVLPIRRYG